MLEKEKQLVDLLAQRLKHYDEKLAVIEQALAEEMKKQYLQRRPPLIVFLARERAVYTYVSNELKSISDFIRTHE